MANRNKERLLALDVYRGITIAAMILVNTPGSWDHVYPPLLHSEWQGCTFTDLIFPSFLFIIGVSMWFSFKKYPPGLNKRLLRRIAKRSLIIFLIGLCLRWFPFYDLRLDDLHFAGVLQRIAVCYFFSALICVSVRVKWVPVIAAFLLLVYWAWICALTGDENFSREAVFRPGMDLVSLRSCISSSVPILIGYLTGYFLHTNGRGIRSVAILVAAGLAMILTGKLWGESFPIIKSLLWSSSYVLYTSGIALVVFAFSVWVFDQHRLKLLAFPFSVFGLNPLFIYAVSILADKVSWLVEVGDVSLHHWLYSEIFLEVADPVNASFLYALCFVALNWCLAYWLYTRRLIIKV